MFVRTNLVQKQRCASFGVVATALGFAVTIESRLASSPYSARLNTLGQRGVSRSRGRLDLHLDFDACTKTVDDPKQAVKRESPKVGVADA